jgi:hypothetical protein
MISLALFLIVSIGYVTATNKVDLTTFEGIIEITKLYFSWLGSLFKNIMSLTGYAVKQDWGVNFSNFTIGK